MHASLAFVNGAGNSDKDLRLLKTLLSTASEAPRPGESKDERQADKDSKMKPASKPGGFQNDPNDPNNPNEVREKTLKKIKR